MKTKAPCLCPVMWNAIVPPPCPTHNPAPQKASGLKERIRFLSLVAILGLIAAALACGKGTIEPPTGPSASCPTTITGNGNAVACGQGNSVTQNPAPTPTPAPTPGAVAKECEIAYNVIEGPETIATLDSKTYGLTPWGLDAAGQPTKVPDRCNEPRAPKVRWSVTGSSGQVTGSTACEPMPTDPPGSSPVCGFMVTVKRVTTGQFGLTAIVDQRGATRYIN